MDSGFGPKTCSKIGTFRDVFAPTPSLVPMFEGAGNVSANSAISRVLNYPAYSDGMEDAVVDLVVIQWIMQKLRRDRMRLSGQLTGQWQNFDENN